MPNYPFHCESCGQTFEALVSLGVSKTVCPHCKHKAARRLLSAPRVHFKGGGFYKTDSKGTPKTADKPSPSGPGA